MHEKDSWNCSFCYISPLGIIKFLWQILIYYNQMFFGLMYKSIVLALLDFQYAFLDLTETKQQIWKTLSFYKINFTTCSPLNGECLKNSKPRVFSLLSLHQCKCMKYRCQCSTPATLLYQTIVFYYQRAVMSHACVVMVMVGCIRQYTKN